MVTAGWVILSVTLTPLASVFFRSVSRLDREVATQLTLASLIPVRVAASKRS